MAKKWVRVNIKGKPLTKLPKGAEYERGEWPHKGPIINDQFGQYYPNPDWFDEQRLTYMKQRMALEAQKASEQLGNLNLGGQQMDYAPTAAGGYAAYLDQRRPPSANPWGVIGPQPNEQPGRRSRIPASVFGPPQAVTQGTGGESLFPQWNYQDPPKDQSGRPLNNDGLPLPEGALGFDPAGNPYWSSEWTGVRSLVNKARAAWWRMTATPVQNWVQEPVQAAMSGALTNIPELYGLAAGAASLVRGKTAEQAPGILDILPRVPGEAIMGIGEVFSTLAQEWERQTGALELTNQELGYRIPIRELYKDIFPEYLIEGAALKSMGKEGQGYKILDWLIQGAHLETAYPGIVSGGRALFDTEFRNQYTSAIKRNYESARIAYSIYWEPTLKAEVERQIMAGGDPALVTMALQNPIAEAVGQTIFDPLNVLTDVVASPLKAAKFGKASDIFTKLDEPIELGFKALSEAKSESAAAQAGLDLTKAVMTAVDDTRAGMRVRYGPTRLIATGLRDFVSSNVGNLTQAIFNAFGKDWERGFDTLYGLALITSDHADEAARLKEVQAGVDMLSHFPGGKGKFLFSEGARETGILMRKMLTNADGELEGARFLERLTENSDTTARLSSFIAERMEPALKELYPTVSDMRLAAQAVEAGKSVTATQRKLAKVYEELSPIVRAIGQTNDTVLAKIASPFNQFFANVYMGLSPGFAFRNFANNAFTTFVDMGPRPALEAAGAGLREFASYIGFGERGATFTNKVEWMRNVFGVVPTSAFEFVGTKGIEGVQAAKGFARMNILGLSADVERGMGASIVASSLQRSLEKMIQPGRAIPDVGELLAVGFTREQTWTVQRIIMDNYGDVDKVWAALSKAFESGAVDVVRNPRLWVTDSAWQMLQSYGLDSRFTEILQKATSAEEAQTMMGKTWKEIVKLAEKAKLEGVPLAADDPLAPLFAGIQRAVKDGAIEVDEAHLMSMQVKANEAAFRRMEVAIENTRNIGLVYAPNQAANISNLARQVTDKQRQLSEGVGAATTAIRDAAWEVAQAVESKGLGKVTKEDIVRLWNQHDALTAIASEPKYVSRGDDLAPLGRQFKNWMWDELIRPYIKGQWDETRKVMSSNYDEYLTALKGLIPNLDLDKFVDVARADDAIKTAEKWAATTAADVVKKGAPAFREGVSAAKLKPVEQVIQDLGLTLSPREAQAILREKLKLPRVAWEASTPEDMEKFKDILRAWAKENNVAVTEKVAEGVAGAAPEAAKVAETIGQVLNPPLDPGSVVPPSTNNMWLQNKDGLKTLWDSLTDGVGRNWDRKQSILVDEKKQAALTKFLEATRGNVAEAKLKAMQYANATRDFVLLNYGQKTQLDVALAYIFPYHFWYSRSYANWMQRMVFNANLVASYARYKDTLAKLHADMPEWWRYNINSNELLGLDSENPLFFNLEATLNPLNGLTGVDFEDPYKRVNWWTRALDDIGKFGPTVWTPIQAATGLALYLQGDEDAGQRWMGRLVPQTAMVKSLTAILNQVAGIGPKGGVELDPFVIATGGGNTQALDAYERRRVGRALAQLVADGLVSEADAFDAAKFQRGPIWQDAMQKAAMARAPGQLASFFLGVGFKARTQSDMQIDQFYEDYARLWTIEPTLKSSEFRQLMDALHEMYPFMDSILLSRKGGIERDRAYAYGILGRIPPGQTSEVFKAYGLDPKLIDKFYDTKGDFSTWGATDKSRFMDAMVDMGTMLDLPPETTRREWASARIEYSAMNERAVTIFGDDILDRVDAYFRAKDISREAANALLAADPGIEQYLDWKSQYIQSDPLLSRYYGGIQTIRGYLEGQMYDAIEVQLGAIVWDEWYEYNLLKDTGGDYREYWNTHPNLEKYMAIKDAWGPVIDARIVELGLRLPEQPPAYMRPNAPNYTIGQQAIYDYLNPAPQPRFTVDEWRNVLPAALLDVVTSGYINGERLPEAAMRQLRELAAQWGVSIEMLLNELQLSLQAER